MKRTHKFKEMNDVAAVVAKASSLSAAAKALGVDRSTLHRWLGSGKVKRPRSKPRQGTAMAAPTTTPHEWAAGVQTQYRLAGTDLELLRLATDALAMAKDATAATRDRLGAMARFQQLVRQLNLEAISEVPAAPVRQLARRASGDPRAILMAVK